MLVIVSYVVAVCSALDTILPIQVVKGDTIVSMPGDFNWHFLASPEPPWNRYNGMWYKFVSVQTVIWVANR